MTVLWLALVLVVVVVGGPLVCAWPLIADARKDRR